MELRPVRLVDAEAEPVITGLSTEYLTRYGSTDEVSSVPAEDFDPPAGLFLVLVDGDTTVAAGGYRRLAPGACEVKRMWVRPDRRRQGHATTVLTALEGAARAAGYRTLRLETGPAQPEAAALYAGRGYRRIPVFGPYPSALAFERDLSP